LSIFKDVDKIESWKYILATEIPFLKLKKGTIINDYIKISLKKNGVFIVPVFQNKASEVSVIDKKIIEKSYAVIKEKFQKLQIDSKINAEIIDEISQGISDSIDKNFGDFLYLPLKKLKDFDEYTFTHSLNVGTIAALIAKSMNLPKKTLNKVVISGILHDVGKSKLNVDILNAPRKLTLEEFKHIKDHVIYGKNILLENNVTDKEIIDGVLYHHERYDGNGYQSGLINNEIPLFGKLIGIADIYDALTSRRTYKDIWNNYKVVSHIIQNSCKMFDPTIINYFLKIFGLYPPGTIVQLNDRRTGTVVASRKDNELQPLVQIGSTVIDLKEKGMFILNALEGDENFE
jgi:HD-GYP domain-containing protein (c-di-GMP phosphodiesterase class II)